MDLLYIDLTVRSSVTVHLQALGLFDDKVFLGPIGSNLTMQIDINGILWDQYGDVGSISLVDGSVNFLPPDEVTNNYVVEGWTTDPSDLYGLVPPSGFYPVGCDNMTANAYQLYIFAAPTTTFVSYPLPSCTALHILVCPAFFILTPAF
jgi:hypothetical protein